MVSLAEELSNKVFNNSYLLEYILSHVTDEIVENFKMRLISRAFNNGCLAAVRAKFRVLSIVFEEESNGYKGLKNEFVHLNGHGVKISKVSPCFLFLKDVVRLKVEELEVKEIWKLKKTLRKQFHDSIHSDLIGENHKSIRKLTGLEEACFGCPKCWKFTEYVQEYGPLRFRSLKAIKKPINIRRLIVNDLLFQQIANVCVKDSSTKEECYRKMDSMINVPIQCDTLVFWISESRKLRKRDDSVSHQYMPREVLELMIQKWKPKSIGIHFKYNFRNDVCDTRWIESEYFSKVRLIDPYEPFTDDSPLSKFDHVELNLRDSRHCAGSIRFLHSQHAWHKGYENVIANIRNLFPTDRISVKEFNIFTSNTNRALIIFSNLLKIIQLGNRENLTLNFKFFIGYYHSDDSETNLLGTTEIPAEYMFLNHRSIFYHQEFPDKSKEGPDELPTMKWISKRLRFEDKQKEFQFNLDVFLPLKVLNPEIEDTPTKSLMKIFE